MTEDGEHLSLANRLPSSVSGRFTKEIDFGY